MKLVHFPTASSSTNISRSLLWYFLYSSHSKDDFKGVGMSSEDIFVSGSGLGEITTSPAARTAVWSPCLQFADRGQPCVYKWGQWTGKTSFFLDKNGCIYGTKPQRASSHWRNEKRRAPGIPLP